jgi:hypothetical protein
MKYIIITPSLVSIVNDKGDEFTHPISPREYEILAGAGLSLNGIHIPKPPWYTFFDGCFSDPPQDWAFVDRTVFNIVLNIMERSYLDTSINVPLWLINYVWENRKV